MQKETTHTALVVGGGPAGLTAAILLARAGLSTVLIAPDLDASRGSTLRDARTTALMQGAIRMLDRIGLWAELSAHAAPLRRLKLVDNTNWQLKAPTVVFDCDEIDGEPFGWNIPNDRLNEALEALARQTDGLDLVDGSAHRVTVSRHSVSLTTADGTAFSSRVIAAADGRNSAVRQAAGLLVTDWDYDQTAIACSFAHERPHNETSIEFHRPNGPLTLVPLPANRSSLVWVDDPDTASALMALPDSDFEERLRDASHDALGQISDCGPRQSFPLKGMTAQCFAASRVALVGESGHVIPPIGAQGLNLGMRDAAHLAELAGNAHGDGGDPGGDEVMTAYDRQRRRDVLPRTAAVHMLNRSLLSRLPFLHGARGLGLFALDTVPALRHMVMQQGIAPEADLPALMRRDADTEPAFTS